MYKYISKEKIDGVGLSSTEPTSQTHPCPVPHLNLL